MKCATAFTAALIALAGAVSVLAQAPDFSGTWKLDAKRSRITKAAGLAGLIGAGAPARLHITHAANGTLVVESEINESHARIYTPGVKSTTPIFVGRAGSITMTSRWDGRSVVGEGRREFISSASPRVTEVKEVFALSMNRKILEITITTMGADGKNESSLVYTRAQTLGPCESWPSPCKSPSR